MSSDVRVSDTEPHGRFSYSLGWGTFTIAVSVVLKARYVWESAIAKDMHEAATQRVLPLEWILDFDGHSGRGSMRRITSNFKKVEAGKVEAHEPRRRVERQSAVGASKGEAQRRTERQSAFRASEVDAPKWTERQSASRQRIRYT